MKSAILLLGILLFCFTYQSTAKNSVDYAAYFETVLSAEHKLANDQLSAALDEYLGLFRQFDFVFARDTYHALQLAIIAGRRAQRDTLLIHCAKSGVPDHLLRKNLVVFAAYANDTRHFEVLYAKGNAIYLRRIDSELRSEMRQRYEDEQASKGGAEYARICTENFNRVAELTRQGRFPGEQVVGVNDDLGYGYAFPTLLHYPYAYVLLYDHLWAALHKGQLQPLSLMYLYSFNQTRTSKLYSSRIPVDTQHFKLRYNISFGLQSSDSTAVDSARKTVWLRPQSEKQMILAVAKKYGIDFREGW